MWDPACGNGDGIWQGQLIAKYLFNVAEVVWEQEAENHGGSDLLGELVE